MSLFTRSKNNPILKPNPKNDWESFKVYNPGAIYENGKYHLFYRAVGRGENWRSVIGYAVSSDGENFERFEKPVLEGEEEEEKRGVEDPRITKVNDVYFMSYTSWDGVNPPQLKIATSNDLVRWEKQGTALPNFHFVGQGGVYTKFREGKSIQSSVLKGDDKMSKAGGIFPEKIKGKYWMLFNEHRIWLASSSDGVVWDAPGKPFLEPRGGDYFDNTFVEMGPSPIKTEKGWFVIYHGINDAHYYRLGYLLLDINDPAKIIYRSEKPIFEPKESYELGGIVDVLPGGLRSLQKMDDEELKNFLKEMSKRGFMPKVTFCPGAVLVGDVLRIYYGAGDSFVCTATARLNDILRLTP